MSTTTCSLGDTATIDLWTGVNKTRVRVAAAAGALTLKLNSVNGFGEGDDLLINAPGVGPDEEPERVTIAAGGIDPITRQVTFTPALLRAHAVGQEVMEARDPTTATLTGDDPESVDLTGTLASFTKQLDGWYIHERLMDKRGTWTFRIRTAGARPIAGTEVITVEVS